MSSTSNSTEYQLTLDLEGNNAQAEATLRIPGLLGMTDTQVFDLVATLKAFPWPTGVTVVVSVFKSSQTSVAYTTNMAATPPSFT